MQTRLRGALDSTGRILIQTGKEFVDDNMPQWAAAVAFYSLLSLFPLLVAIVSIASYYVNTDWAVDQILRLLGEFLPAGEERVSEVVKSVVDARGPASLVSIAFLLWSGTRVFGVLTKALNLAYDSDDAYGFFKRRLVELIMLLVIGLLFTIALASRWLIGFLWGRVDIFPGEQGLLFFVLNALVPPVLLLIVFFLIFRFIPKTKVNNGPALAGALLSVILFLVARSLFLRYIQSLANYNLVYGSLAVVVIMMIWAWITSLIILFGGVLTSKVQERR